MGSGATAGAHNRKCIPYPFLLQLAHLDEVGLIRLPCLRGAMSNDPPGLDSGLIAKSASRTGGRGKDHEVAEESREAAPLRRSVRAGLNPDAATGGGAQVVSPDRSPCALYIGKDGRHGWQRTGFKALRRSGDLTHPAPSRPLLD